MNIMKIRKIMKNMKNIMMKINKYQNIKMKIKTKFKTIVFNKKNLIINNIKNIIM